MPLLLACSFLTNEGIEYLRTYLNLSPEVVPATHKKAPIPTRAPIRERTERTFRPRDGPREGGREGYRTSRFAQGAEGEKKLAQAPSDFKPRFGGRGGAREGAAAPQGFSAGRGRAPQ